MICTLRGSDAFSQHEKRETVKHTLKWFARWGQMSVVERNHYVSYLAGILVLFYDIPRIRLWDTSVPASPKLQCVVTTIF